MPSPFPGMDPFLEHPTVFPDLHDSAITYLREALQAKLPATYYAAIGSRDWVESSQRLITPDINVLRRSEPSLKPDSSAGGGVAVATAARPRPIVVRVLEEEIRENFVEIYARDGRQLVTAIELLSLTNKSPGPHGLDLYRLKQAELLQSKAHLVEIDLLRSGEHVTSVPLGAALAGAGPYDYHVCIRRFDAPNDYLVYPIRLEERLPVIDVPLLPADPPVSLDLQALLDRCYDAGAYGQRVEYGQMRVVPPLRPEQAEWAARVLREKCLLPPVNGT